MRRVIFFVIIAALGAGAGISQCLDHFVHPLCARAVLLDPDVREYLHTDLPSRRPLLVSDRRLLAKEADLDLPFPVRIVRGVDPKQSESFQFTGADPGEDDTMVVTFEFPPEGMRGQAAVRHTKDGCMVLAREVHEH